MMMRRPLSAGVCCAVIVPLPRAPSHLLLFRKNTNICTLPHHILTRPFTRPLTRPLRMYLNPYTLTPNP